MKLNEFLKNHFKQVPDEMHDYTLMPEHLKILKDELLKCEEFSNVKTFNIIEKLPEPAEIERIKSDKGISFKHIYSETDEQKFPLNYKFGTNFKFNEEISIYSIMLSPPIYNLNEKLKNGWAVAPTLMDSYEFKPFKKIIYQYSPEQFQDELALNYDETKNKLISEFKDFLDNMNDEKYQIKSKRNIIIRALPSSVGILPNRDFREDDDIYVIGL